jgi:YVTN family beta-propeller protein
MVAHTADPGGTARVWRRVPAAGLALAVLAGFGLVLVGASAVAATPAPTAYVGNEFAKTVTPIDTATNKPGKPIKVGSFPDAIAITPNGGTVYVANGGDGTVTPIDTANGRSGTPIKVGDMPDAIAVTPDGATAYVANAYDGDIVPVNTATNTVGRPIKLGDGVPDAIAITPNGATAYVGNSYFNTVTPVDLATGQPSKPIPVPDPVAIAITPNGATAYVASEGLSNIPDTTVTPINLATGKAGKAITVGAGPDAIAITPNGATAYVANVYGGTVTPINTATNKPGKTISVGTSPEGIAVTPNGATAYVAGDYDKVTPISTATNKAGKTITAGSGPAAIAMTPGWTNEVSAPQGLTQSGPSLASYRGQLYAAWLGEAGDANPADTNRVVYMLRDGSSVGHGWSAQFTVSGAWGAADTNQAPALVVYSSSLTSVGAGDLFAFWTGYGGQIYYSISANGTSWSVKHAVSGSWGNALSSRGPAVATFGGDLYVAWKGKSSDHLFYSQFNGSSWSPQVSTGEVGSKFSSPYAPAIVGDPGTGGPVVAWTTSGDKVDLIYCLGTSKFACGVPVGQLSQPGTNRAPALAFMGTSANNALYLSWKGATTNKVFYAASFSLPGGLTTGFSPQETVPQALTTQHPSLAVSGYTLYVGWTGMSSDAVSFASADTPY